MRRRDGGEQTNHDPGILSHELARSHCEANSLLGSFRGNDQSYFCGPVVSDRWGSRRDRPLVPLVPAVPACPHCLAPGPTTCGDLARSSMGAYLAGFADFANGFHPDVMVMEWAQSIRTGSVGITLRGHAYTSEWQPRQHSTLLCTCSHTNPVISLGQGYLH